jgi:hypothetical protein
METLLYRAWENGRLAREFQIMPIRSMAINVSFQFSESTAVARSPSSSHELQAQWCAF